jgi:SAM-dependent MidA family methyltransferase
MSLPTPDPAAAENSARLVDRIAAEIERAGGWIPFSRYMELALYAPGLGYYGGGARKFGAAGDFVTAPELSPLFAQALAAQVAQILAASAPRLLEAGAGSGALAVGLLLELERRGALPERYEILELSGELRARQQDTLARGVPHLADRVAWLDTLPERFSGVVVANELLDALPVNIVAWREDGVFERGVALANGAFIWQERPASGALLAVSQGLTFVAPPYVSEIALAARAWIAEWGRILRRGALLLIDYGFPQREYYHPQRAEGTLMCHYRHHAHGDPFWLPGLNDLTAHVDFTAICLRRPRRRTGRARLHQPGAVPPQLRPRAIAGSAAGRRRNSLRRARLGRAETHQPRRDGRTVQGALAGKGNRWAAAGLRARRPPPRAVTQRRKTQGFAAAVSTFSDQAAGTPARTRRNALRPPTA